MNYLALAVPLAVLAIIAYLDNFFLPSRRARRERKALRQGIDHRVAH